MARKSADRTMESSAKRGRAGKKAEPMKEPARGEMAVGERAEEKRGMGESSTMTLTHDQIANRARSIWERRGRPQGEDDKIWHAAEAELKQEMGIGH